MSEAAIIRAYMLDIGRGLLLTAAIIVWITTIAALLTDHPEFVGSLGLPILFTAGIGWDFLRFRRARRSR